MDILSNSIAPRMAERFRGFLPVVVDVETGGFDAEHDALLEIAAVPLAMDEGGYLKLQATVSTHVEPFPGANLDPRSLEITGIDPTNPLRGALAERQALDHVFHVVREAVREAGWLRSQAQSIPPVQLFRYGQPWRPRLRPDRAEQGGAGRWPCVRQPRGAFGGV
jgi:ribonuclease T